MKAYFILPGIIFLFLVTSCNKDKPENNNSSNSIKLLREFKYVEDGDTTTKYSFTYDANNRIATSHVFEYENGLLADEELFTFLYDSNDSFPSKVHAAFTDYINPISGYSEEYFFYNSERRLVKDSIADEAGGPDFSYDFTYYPGYLKITTSFRDTVLNRQVLANENIVSETDSISGIFTSMTVYHEETTFDEHPNPFYRTGIKRTLHYMPDNYIDDAFMAAVKNNILEISTSTSGLQTYNTHIQNTYAYDASGYPVTINSTDVIYGYNGKGFYFY